ncbi:hypothetical protein CW736_06775 [Nonlabens sp. MB-3u-79]|nr:hypothetical protein CW736_06775 [Nonlabens sp. MB-3u-79]
MLVIDTCLKKVLDNNLPLLELASNLQIINNEIKTSKGLLLLRIGLTGFYVWNQSTYLLTVFFPSTIRIVSKYTGRRK